MNVVKRLFRRVYYRWFWVQDWTEGMSVWFDRNNNILPDDYEGGNCSDTVHPKNWHETYKILSSMKEYGCKEVRVTVFVSIFGRRRYSTDYDFNLDLIHDKEIK